ncbi:hypothetical protein MPSEU_000829100 [Mayamaea pseudoterrestris]|nr:hypothetical protein MPSEU_000829100 [Mayamaea pseudoterrestris]
MSEPFCVTESAAAQDVSTVAWNVHQAVETLRQLDLQDVPAMRRTLRGLDRATIDLVTHLQNYNTPECPVVLPDYYHVDVQHILARPYVPDEQAQILLANVLSRLAPFLQLSPDNLNTLLSLLVSWVPRAELQVAWLQLLVHAGHIAWETQAGVANVLTAEHGGALAATRNTSSSNPCPWFERLFLLLQRVLNEQVPQWSVKEAKSKEHAALVLWRGCIIRVLNVISQMYRSQATMAVDTAAGNGFDQIDMLTWMFNWLASHLQSSATQPPLQTLEIRCSNLLKLTGRFAQQMVEYAMDALDGALIAATQQQQDEDDADASANTYWAMHQAMYHFESAVYVLQLTAEWKIVPDLASTLEAMWKQCSQAFIGQDEDGVVARVLLQVATQYLEIAAATSIGGTENGSIPLDMPVFILTLFRAVESCPSALLEAKLLWSVLASQLKESKCKDVRSAVQLVLFSLSTELVGNAADDPVKVELGNKFLRLMNTIRDDIENEGDEWDAYFMRRFTNEQQ